MPASNCIDAMYVCISNHMEKTGRKDVNTGFTRRKMSVFCYFFSCVILHFPSFFFLNHKHTLPLRPERKDYFKSSY